MKAFKEYLTEAIKTYTYRVRIADCDMDTDTIERIKRSLAMFDLKDMTKPKSQPISRSNEFPSLGPVPRHQFEVTVRYPTTPDGIRTAIHACGIPAQHIIVRYPLQDDAELENPEHTPSGKALLVDPELSDADSDAQSHVGLKRVENLLKELSKQAKAEPDQYTGANDALLAKSLPKETKAKSTTDLPQNNQGVLKQNTSPRGK